MDAVRTPVPRMQSVSASESSANSQLAPLPARSFAILTCMDARIDANKLAQLREGDAHVVRNAGARASDDAIRSLMMSHAAFGTREWFVVHHSHCGMALFDDETSRGLLAETLTTAKTSPRARRERMPSEAEGGAVIDWVALQDERHSLVEDVERIRRHPLVPPDVTIYGYLYQTDSGRLVLVHQASSPVRP